MIIASPPWAAFHVPLGQRSDWAITMSPSCLAKPGSISRVAGRVGKGIVKLPWVTERKMTSKERAWQTPDTDCSFRISRKKPHWELVRQILASEGSESSNKTLRSGCTRDHLISMSRNTEGGAWPSMLKNIQPKAWSNKKILLSSQSHSQVKSKAQSRESNQQRWPGLVCEWYGNRGHFCATHPIPVLFSLEPGMGWHVWWGPAVSASSWISLDQRLLRRNIMGRRRVDTGHSLPTWHTVVYSYRQALF